MFTTTPYTYRLLSFLLSGRKLARLVPLLTAFLIDLGPGRYISQGCYSEPAAGRALSGYVFTNTTDMTVEMCVGACNARSFQYAGVEYSQEVRITPCSVDYVCSANQFQCYCGNTLASTAVKVPDAQCNSICKGNKREYCGASK